MSAPTELPGEAEGPRSPRRSRVLQLGDLALWSGLYVAACCAFLFELAPSAVAHSRLDEMPWLLFAFTTAVATYLLDRIKLSDARLDPADPASAPGRHAFLRARAGRVRGLIVLLALGAATLGLRLTPLAPALVAVSLLGVFLYAGRPRAFRTAAPRDRPKDLFGLKNVLVAASITGFATALAFLAGRAPERSPLLLLALFLVVFSDAVLCDIEDTDADRRFETRTVPGRLGAAWAWGVSGLTRLLACAALLTARPDRGGWVWCAGLLVLFLALGLLRPRNLRDWVDGGLACVALAAVLVG